MTKDSLTKEEVNRVIAERVMGWRDVGVDGKWDKNETVFWIAEVQGSTEKYIQVQPGYRTGNRFDPSENPAQFNEAFAKAGHDAQVKAIRKWGHAHRYNGDIEIAAIRTWQLAPISEKAKALAEAVTRTEE